MFKTSIKKCCVGKVRTIVRAHTLLGPPEIDFINGMGAVGGPTSYSFIGPQISNSAPA